MILFTVSKIRSIILIISLGIIINFMNSSEAMADKPLVKLYFIIPFSIETYIPVTVENIEDHGHTIWFMEKHQFILELLSMLKSHPTNKQILSKGIRLKADFGELEGVFFVDQNGVIFQQNTSATFSLSADELEHLQQRLSYFVGVVDIKALKKIK